MNPSQPNTSQEPPDFWGGRRVVDAAILMGCLEIFFIVLFFASRLKMKTAKSLDAYLMIPAFLFSFSLVIISLVGYSILSCFFIPPTTGIIRK
jgi:hypothetical protein